MNTTGIVGDIPGNIVCNCTTDISIMSTSAETGNTSTERNEKSESEMENEEDEPPTLSTNPGEKELREYAIKIRAWGDSKRKLMAARQGVKAKVKKARKRITKLDDLPDFHKLPNFMEHCLKDFIRVKIFRGVKILIKDSLVEGGEIMGRIFKYLGIKEKTEKSRYQECIEIWVKKKIGEYRDNTIKTMQRRYKGVKGRGTSKCGVIKERCSIPHL